VFGFFPFGGRRCGVEVVVLVVVFGVVVVGVVVVVVVGVVSVSCPELLGAGFPGDLVEVFDPSRSFPRSVEFTARQRSVVLVGPEQRRFGRRAVAVAFFGRTFDGFDVGLQRARLGRRDQAAARAAARDEHGRRGAEERREQQLRQRARASLPVLQALRERVRQTRRADRRGRLPPRRSPARW